MKKLLGLLLVSMGLVSGLHSAACLPVADRMVLVQLQALKADGSEYRLPVKKYPQSQLQRFTVFEHLFEDIEDTADVIPVALQGATADDFDLLVAMAYSDVRPLSICQKKYVTCLLDDFDRVLAVYRLAHFLDPKDKRFLYPFVMALISHIEKIDTTVSFKNRMSIFLGIQEDDYNPRYAFLKKIRSQEVLFLVDQFAALVADRAYQHDVDDMRAKIRTFLTTSYLVGTLTNQAAQQLADGIKMRAVIASEDDYVINRIENYIPGLVENYPAVPYARSVELMVGGKRTIVQKPGPERFPLSIRDLLVAGAVDPHLMAPLKQIPHQFIVSGFQKITSLDGLLDIPNIQSIQALHFGGNYISTLSVGMFKDFTSLVILNLNDNRLRELKKGVFDGLTKLQWLLLEKNEIRTLDAGVFSNLTNLMTLNLKGNHLTVTAQQICEQNGNIWPYWKISLNDQRP